MATRTDYLILGNSAAGVTAAEEIRAADADASILIVSPEPYAVYGRPLISYLLEGKTDEENIGFKDEGFYERNRFDTLFGPGYAAESIEAEAHRVTLTGGDVVEYGKCLVATGSIPFMPPIKGLEGMANVVNFLTLDDALTACEQAKAATAAAHAEGRESRIIVIGGGLIGLKAAESLSLYTDDMVVLELAPHILPAVLDDEGAAVLSRQLADRGIRCLAATTADELLGGDGRINAARLTDGETLSCDLVVAAVGVRPNSAIAVAAGAAQGRGLIVGEDLRTTLPDVYAAGDVTQVTDLLDGSQKPLALWPNAMRQGKLAGRHMAGVEGAEPFAGNFAINAVDFFDISLLTAGIINPPADGGYETRVFLEGERYAKFILKDDRLFGYILLNRPDNAGIYTSIIDRKMPLSSFGEGFLDGYPSNLEFEKPVRWARLHKYYPTDRDELGWKEGVR